MLVPAWSATPPSRQSRNASGEKLPTTSAQTLPTNTGMMLAVNEKGRVARYQTTGQSGVGLGDDGTASSRPGPENGPPPLPLGGGGGQGVGALASDTASARQQAVRQQAAGSRCVRRIDVLAHVERWRHLLRHEEVVELLEIDHVHLAVWVMIRQAAGRDRGCWHLGVLLEDRQVL